MLLADRERGSREPGGPGRESPRGGQTKPQEIDEMKLTSWFFWFRHEPVVTVFRALGLRLVRVGGRPRLATRAGRLIW